LGGGRRVSVGEGKMEEMERILGFGYALLKQSYELLFYFG
jgi:hypothetical protein